MKNKTGDLVGDAVRAFAAGATGAGDAQRFESHSDRQTEALAKAQRERDEARQELARSNVAANVTEIALARDITDATDRKRVTNLVESERQRCQRSGETFDWKFEALRAVHTVKTKKGEPSLAPVHPTRTEPTTLADVTAERERYRARLRELGLLDPAFGSTPGDGLLSGGGPIAAK